MTSTVESSTNTCALQLTIETLNLTLTLTLQHAVVNIQLNIVTCPTYPQISSYETVLFHRLYYFRL